MRDIVVFLVFGVGILYALRNPYYGVLLWSLFNYMNPHRLTWGPAFNFPFVYIIAIVTILSFIVSREKRPVSWSAPLVLWLLFIAWMTITTLFALEPDSAQEQLIKVLKIQVPVLMTLFLFYDKKRINSLISVIAISIGFFGVKGGLFTLMSGGGYIVWGPPGTFIYGNNELAIAILTVIPLFFYLRSQTKNLWLRRFLLFCAGAMLISVIGSQSRGAFLALLALGGYFWWMHGRKLAWAVGLSLIVAVGAFTVPDSWKDRMSTIQDYEEDASAMGRIRAWYFATKLADSRFTGGGFNPWTKRNYLAYSDIATLEQRAFVAHSVYFSVLGEHGWIGLVLYLSILWLTWRQLGKVVKRTKGDAENEWMSELAKTLKVAMIAYFAGGAFLSLAYFDLPWHLVSISLILFSLSNKKKTDPVIRRGMVAIRR